MALSTEVTALTGSNRALPRNCVIGKTETAHQCRHDESPFTTDYSSTTRPFKGCTGRLLSKPIASLSAVIWPGDIANGSFITNHRTPSLQGGVVNEPW